MIMGINPEAEDRYFNLKKDLQAGEFLDGNEHRVLCCPKGWPIILMSTPGDTVVMIGQGYHGISANGQYVVKGIIKLSTPELNNGLAYLAIKEAQELFGAYGRASSLVVIPKDADDFQDISHELTQPPRHLQI